MSTANTLTVTLTSDLERFVSSRVASGLYQSVSEVIEEALSLLRERETALDVPLSELREQIAVGLEQADRGELLDGEEVFRELGERFGMTFDAS